MKKVYTKPTLAKRDTLVMRTAMLPPVSDFIDIEA